MPYQKYQRPPILVRIHQSVKGWSLLGIGPQVCTPGQQQQISDWLKKFQLVPSYCFFSEKCGVPLFLIVGEDNDSEVKCEDEKCKRIVKDIETQIKTLTMGSQVPKAPGLYLMYYNKLFTTKYWESYISEHLNTKWPSNPLYYKPNGITLSLNKVLTNMAVELSNGAWENVSILDLPGFGSMVNDFDSVIKQGLGIFSVKTELCGIPWNNQLNMAIFNEMAKNYSWSKTWEKTINTECLNMKKLWKKYMTTFNATDFPPAIGNNISSVVEF